MNLVPKMRDADCGYFGDRLNRKFSLRTEISVPVFKAHKSDHAEMTNEKIVSLHSIALTSQG